MMCSSEKYGVSDPLEFKTWFAAYPKIYAHGFVVLCFVVVMQSFIMNSHEVFILFHQGCFAGTGAIVRLPQCQWSKPDGYGKISKCITTTKHSKAKTVCIFLGIYCTLQIQHCFLHNVIWLLPLMQIQLLVIINLHGNKACTWIYKNVLPNQLSYLSCNKRSPT